MSFLLVAAFTSRACYSRSGRPDPRKTLSPPATHAWSLGVRKAGRAVPGPHAPPSSRRHSIRYAWKGEGNRHVLQ